MWAELKNEMAGRGWSGLDEVEAIWNNDFSKRKIISGIYISAAGLEQQSTHVSFPS